MSKIKEKQYVFMTFMILVLAVISNLIERFNYVDALYLGFIFVCIIRYIIISLENKAMK